MNQLRELYLQCREQGTPVDPHVAYVAIQAAGDYPGIRSQYVNDVQEAIVQYMLGYEGMAVSKGRFKRAMATSFVDGFETGWVETGGDPYQPEPEDSDWLGTRLDQEIAFIDGLYQTMKAMLADTEEPIQQAEILDYAAARATGYGNTLDAVYGQGKLRGKKNVMLTLDGPDGKESCDTCQRYKGQRHRAKWWLSRDLIPAPGNENYECGGWMCQHTLSSDDGEQWAGVQE